MDRTGLEVQERRVKAAQPVPVRHAQIISEREMLDVSPY